MTLRHRLTLAAAAAVAAAVLAASVAGYLVVRETLRTEVDRSLVARVDEILESLGGARSLRLPPPPRLGGAGGHTQYITADGRVALGDGGLIPVTRRAQLVAAGVEPPFLDDAVVDGTRVRVITVPLRRGIALQAARPLDEMERILGRLRVLLTVVALAGVGLAVALGLSVARTALAPVQRLTDAAERVARTRNPGERVAGGEGSDELSRLASTFNTMLEALDASLRSQRRLVADASHELRTPLTSLRTNLEVLARADAMPGDERERLLADVVSQIDELTALVADLVDLARGDDERAPEEDVRLDRVVEAALAKARTHHPSVRFEASLEPAVVRGVPARLERAVANLLDNAGKWSPPGEAVDVTLAGGVLTVRDRGPGIAPEARPHVFERFYRAPEARGMPGSGLGLAIARQVAVAHGGAVSLECPADGGSAFRLDLSAVSQHPFTEGSGGPGSMGDAADPSGSVT